MVFKLGTRTAIQKKQNNTYHGNALGTSRFLLKTKYPHLQLSKVRQMVLFLFCFVSFYWANLPRGKEHEQDSGPMRGAPPYTIQKDQRDRPQHRELRALLWWWQISFLGVDGPCLR